MADDLRPGKGGAYAVKLRQRGMDWSRRDEPEQREQLLGGLRGPDGQAGALRHDRKGCFGLRGISCGIDAAQRLSEGAHAEVVHPPSRTPQSGPLGNELVHLRLWLVLTAR